MQATKKSGRHPFQKICDYRHLYRVGEVTSSPLTASAEGEDDSRKFEVLPDSKLVLIPVVPPKDVCLPSFEREENLSELRAIGLLLEAVCLPDLEDLCGS